MRIAHLYDYLYSLASPNYFALCLIGHAGRAAAALPAIAALIYYFCSYQTPHIWQYGKNAHFCDLGNSDLGTFVNL
jgi:hypothetical protein